MGRGRRGARDRHRLRRHDDPELADARAAGADQRQRRRGRREQELPLRRDAGRRRARRARAAAAADGRRATGWTRCERRLAQVAAGRSPPCVERDDGAGRARCSRSCSARCPPDDRGRRRHVHPGYWLAGYRRVPRAAQARPTRSAGARSGSGSRPRSVRGLAGAGPTVCVTGDGGFLYACGELATAVAGADSADDRPRRRRRLRHAPLRPGARRRRAVRRRPGRGRTSWRWPASFGVPATTVEGFGPEFERAAAAVDRRRRAADDRRPGRAQATAHDVAALVPAPMSSTALVSLSSTDELRERARPSLSRLRACVDAVSRARHRSSMAPLADHRRGPVRGPRRQASRRSRRRSPRPSRAFRDLANRAGAGPRRAGQAVRRAARRAQGATSPS